MNERETPQLYLIVVLVLSVFAIVALAIEAVIPLDPASQQILMYADWVICGLFFLDFVFTLWRSKNRGRYFLTWGWLDLISSIPAAGFFRFARAARVVRILRILRVARSARLMSTAVLTRRARSGLLTALFASVLLVISTSIAILSVEKSPEANIRTPGDAIWWSLVTITTIGYGDRYAVTAEGRLVAALLMLSGVGLFGIVSGFVATWFLSPPAQAPDPELQAIRQELAELRREIAGLRAQIETPSTRTNRDLPKGDGQ